MIAERRGEVDERLRALKTAPDFVNRLVQRCLAPSPDQRYFSATALQRELEGCRQLHRDCRKMPQAGWLIQAMLQHPWFWLILLGLSRNSDDPEAYVLMARQIRNNQNTARPRSLSPQNTRTTANPATGTDKGTANQSRTQRSIGVTPGGLTFGGSKTTEDEWAGIGGCINTSAPFGTDNHKRTRPARSLVRGIQPLLGKEDDAVHLPHVELLVASHVETGGIEYTD